MIDTRKLNRWRLPDFEAKQIALCGHEVVAGSIILGPKSDRAAIGFTIDQLDTMADGSRSPPYVVLSAQAGRVEGNYIYPTVPPSRRRCTDVEVNRFMKFAGFRITREIVTGRTPYARTFEIAERRGLL